jgi:hypothetical protein
MLCRLAANFVRSTVNLRGAACGLLPLDTPACQLESIRQHCVLCWLMPRRSLDLPPAAPRAEQVACRKCFSPQRIRRRLRAAPILHAKRGRIRETSSWLQTLPFAVQQSALRCAGFRMPTPVDNWVEVVRAGGLEPPQALLPYGFSYQLRLSPPSPSRQRRRVCGLDYPFTVLRLGPRCPAAG